MEPLKYQNHGERVIHIFFLFLLVLAACISKSEGKEDITTIVRTPVTITGIEKEPMAEFVELNATSSFLLKNYVKANANGYIETAHVTPGEYVRSGEVLFTMKTKEAESIGNAINQLDTSFKFSGTNNIRAGSKGFISQLNHQPRRLCSGWRTTRSDQ